MILRKLIQQEAEFFESELEESVNHILEFIHKEGPVRPEDFEFLSYIKKFYPSEFGKYEGRLIYLMGLFFKVEEPESLLELVYSTFAKDIFNRTGLNLTPVQATIYDEILRRRYYSFSAPTSTGKSYVFREIIKSYDKDIIIVVPSRALIAEYIMAINNSIGDDKSILIMQFVENVNIAHTERRIYVITPERGADLFRMADELNIGLILLDEAQISEELIRGMTFDSFVKRINKKLPNITKVFTHPFVENPEAQLQKHDFNLNATALKFDQHSVGKIFLSYKGGSFKYFSPYMNPKRVETIANYDGDIVSDLLNDGCSILIYISKSKIYKREHTERYRRYVELCDPISNQNARKIMCQPPFRSPGLEL